MELLHETEFWVLLGFVLFFALFWRRIGQALLGGLDARAARIRQQLVEAEQLRAEAEAMLRESEQRQRAALEETEKLLSEAKREAARLQDQSARDLAVLLERRRLSAIEKIGQAEATAVAEVRQYAVDIAIAATQRILVEQVKGPLAERMIDQAITELPRRLS
jgi:F-type H+-transporting ATPase subunit b